MKNKKAMELSVNFLVLLIIALVVFGMSIYFITTIYQKANEIPTTDALEKELQDISCGTQKVCLSSSAKTLQAGKFEKENIVTLKIINVVGEEKNFNYNIALIRAIDENKNPIENSKINIVTTTDNFLVKNNEAVSRPIAFELPKDADKGAYLYTITINYVGSTSIYATKQFTLTVV